MTIPGNRLIPDVRSGLQCTSYLVHGGPDRPDSKKVGYMAKKRPARKPAASAKPAVPPDQWPLRHLWYLLWTREWLCGRPVGAQMNLDGIPIDTRPIVYEVPAKKPRGAAAKAAKTKLSTVESTLTTFDPKDVRKVLKVEGESTTLQLKDAYRDEMDLVGRFVADCCVVDPDATVGATALYTRFKECCDTTGERCVNQTRFGAQLTERGFNSDKVGGRVLRYGIALLPEG